MSLASTIALKFKAIRNILNSSLKKDLSNLNTMPSHLISQITGDSNQPGQFASIISNNINIFLGYPSIRPQIGKQQNQLLPKSDIYQIFPLI